MTDDFFILLKQSLEKQNLIYPVQLWMPAVHSFLTNSSDNNSTVPWAQEKMFLLKHHRMPYTHKNIKQLQKQYTAPNSDTNMLYQWTAFHKLVLPEHCHFVPKGVKGLQGACDFSSTAFNVWEHSWLGKTLPIFHYHS